uniref:endonuclease/exonuclease/phosphatase family protein n=1 Tax=Herbidospora sakaeratensis TaxID=564415 RepID=UPI00078115C3|nr:endonuclease/exonuclease/phosphatase family protein [Herbidospora sakaeratensis]
MRRLLALVLAVAAVTLTVQPAEAAADGTLSVTSASVAVGSDLRFSYTTPRPDAANWVGLYADPGNGPVDETYVGPSLKWVYAPSANGTGTLPTSGLAAGNYKLFFLYDDGYTWLAEPVSVRLTAPGSGTLTLASATVNSGDPIRLGYTTSKPNNKNWVGLYRNPGNGPVGQTQVGPSLTWAYTPGSSGSATLPTSGLSAGDYVVYYLFNDGYTWLAPPVTLRITSNAAPRFPASAFTLRNAKVGAAYSATVGGLVPGAAFTKTSGPAWASVSSSGAVTGTPTSAGDAVVGIRATTAAGTADATVTIRVQSGVLVPQFRALSWNLWHGGTQVANGLEKQLKFLLERDVDVVGIQENQGSAAQTLAAALGWSYFQNSDTAVLSRYPITGTTPTVAGSAVAARIDLGSRSLRLWSAHLGYTPYGPYDACFGRMSVQQLMNREASSGRTGQITTIISAMSADLAASATTPVLLTGDFNAPSHLDWTSGNSRCGYGAVAWPTSTAPANAGLVDSYRQANPNPSTHPGTTWSPVFTTFTGGYGYDSRTGEPEPQDRIDFVHYRGPLTVLSSEAVWEGTPSQHNPSANAWTSDHAAVLTVFRLN